MKKILIALAVLAVAAGAWFYASPWWTLRAMREAASDKDSAALSRHVDYEALRTDLKGDLRRSMMAEMRKRPDNRFAALGMTIAMRMIDPMIEAMVSPKGVEAMFTGQRDDEQAKAPATATPSLANAAPGDDPVIERTSLDEFRVRGEGKDSAMIFRRHGLGWKLSAVDFPTK